jgi:hypothetical protein
MKGSRWNRQRRRKYSIGEEYGVSRRERGRVM